ncbi:MAG TPA: CBS domain-containing protein [Gemmataceae bacterium]|nr:CBS domain-containing protein [Gemmataceae bacterium]
MICPVCSHDNLPGAEQCSHCLQDLTPLDRPTPHDRIERSLLEDCVAVLNPRPAVTLPPTATVGDALRTMLERNVGALLIVDDAGKLLGIFSERDLLTKATDDPTYAARRVDALMTPKPETVRPTDPLAFVLHKMDGGGYRHLPVVQNGRVVGMVSVRDMLKHITRLCKAGCGGGT